MAADDSPDTSVLKALGHRAVAAPFLDDDQWGLLPIPARRRVAAQLFNNVFKDAAAAGRRGGFDDATAHIARRVLDLDERGRRELSEAVLALLKRAEAIQERSDARQVAARSDDTDAYPSELAILHFATHVASDAPQRARAKRPPRLP